MPYIIKSTEKTRNIASDFETKALFHLMCFGPDNKDIKYFIVDVFNDLTAHDSFMRKSWDMQSKGSSYASPKEIGKELVTLFKNYLSDFSFEYCILFVGGVSSTFRKDNSKNEFDYTNIKDTAYIKMKEGLEEEAKLKTYIDNEDITDLNIEGFLKTVLFVIGNYEKSFYIKKAISPLNSHILPDNETLDRIFNIIRDEQSSKKNNGNLENKELCHMDEALTLKRHLTICEIKLKILNEIIGRDILNGSIPYYFVDKIQFLTPQEKKDTIEDCVLTISKVLNDKNNSEQFWVFFNTVYELVFNEKETKNGYNVDDIYDLIPSSVLEKVNQLDVLAAKFFIAKVMEAVL